MKSLSTSFKHILKNNLTFYPLIYDGFSFYSINIIVWKFFRICILSCKIFCVSYHWSCIQLSIIDSSLCLCFHNYIVWIGNCVFSDSVSKRILFFLFFCLKIDVIVVVFLNFRQYKCIVNAYICMLFQTTWNQCMQTTKKPKNQNWKIR